MEEDRMPKRIFTRELEGTRRRARPRKKWKERSRKRSSSAGSEKMEKDGDREKKNGRILFNRPKLTAGCSAMEEEEKEEAP
jgi:hypothetical protein